LLAMNPAIRPNMIHPIMDMTHAPLHRDRGSMFKQVQ
jgi:hypothetical protein